MSGLKSAPKPPVSSSGQAVTRQGALLVHALSYMSAAGVGVAAFAEALADAYFAMVPEGMRRAPLKVASLHGDGDEYYRIRASNMKAVQRYLDGTVPLPEDLEEVVVAVLPPERRDAAIFDLCCRYHVLPVRVGQGTDVRALADLMREEAALIEAMAPIMADGEINADDRENAQIALPKVRAAMASLAALQVRLEAVVGESSLAVVGKPR